MSDSASFRRILKALGLCVFLCLAVFLFSSCNKNSSQEISQHDEHENIKLTTTIDKTSLYLPQFITISLSAELPENKEIKIAINKKYKQHFKLENTSLQKHSATIPERIILHYTYVFSPVKTGTFFLPGFDVTMGKGAGKSSFTTDSLSITILSLLPNTSVQDSVSIRPISKRIPSGSASNFMWWVLLISGGLVFWFSRKFSVKQKVPEMHPPGIQDYLVEIKHLKTLNLDAQSFDFKINAILQKVLEQSGYSPDQKSAFQQEWHREHHQQSYAQKQAETTRQAQLTAFILKKFGG